MISTLDPHEPDFFAQREAEKEAQRQAQMQQSKAEAERRLAAAKRRPRRQVSLDSFGPK